MNDLTRRKIKGISFRRSSTHFFPKKRQAINFELSETELKAGVAVPLNKKEIQRLMHDLGRQELHTLVSECVENASHWKQISKAMEKNETRFLGDDEDEEFSLRAIQARTNYRSWLHRLKMLELISDAQWSIQDELKLAEYNKNGRNPYRKN